MRIDGLSAKGFLVRVLFSLGITASVGVVAYSCLRWLLTG
jgi:hypothetical protein